MKNANLDKVMVTPDELVKAREILGVIAKDMPDNELIDQIVAMKSLSEKWLDEYEKSVFDGKTLREKLSE